MGKKSKTKTYLHWNWSFGRDDCFSALADTCPTSTSMEYGQIEVVDSHYFQEPITHILLAVLPIPRPRSSGVALKNQRRSNMTALSTNTRTSDYRWTE